MLKLFAVLLIILAAVALVGIVWAWVVMLIAEQREFNEDAEGDENEGI